MNNFGLADEAKRRARGSADRPVDGRAPRAPDAVPPYLCEVGPKGSGRRAGRRCWRRMRTVAAAAEKAEVQLVMENHNHGRLRPDRGRRAGHPRRRREPGPRRSSSTPATTSMVSTRSAGRRGLPAHVHAKFRQVGVDGRDALGRPRGRDRGAPAGGLRRAASPSSTRARKRRRRRCREQSRTCAASSRPEAIA